METRATIRRAGGSDFQSVFMTSIRSRLPVHLSLSDELAELLNISRDSAYRRIREETTLTLNEVKILCERFNLSFDSLMAKDSGLVSFAPNAQYGPGLSIKSWLESIQVHLKTMKAAPNASMIWNSKDLPIFHFFPFTALTAFKFYWWMSLTQGSASKSKYDERQIGADLTSLAARIWDIYAQISSTIVVNREMINSTLRQIEYACDGGFLSRVQALSLCNDCAEMVRQLEDQTQRGMKHDGPSGDSGEHNVYLNELVIGDDTILFKAGDQRTTFVTYQNFNVMSTTHDSFCSQTEHYMNAVIQKGVLISRVAEKERVKFFNRIQSEIQETKAVLEKQ